VNALGEPVRPELYSDRFRALCREAGLRTIHLHLIRHTLAGELIRAGVTMVDAAALLGHTPDVFVSTYLRKSEAGVRSAASALGAAFASGSEMNLERCPIRSLGKLSTAPDSASLGVSLVGLARFELATP
jgi:hypothetical protein